MRFAQTILARNPGVIHGRFQVLHNDHLAYLLAGKAECEHLVVGITNPDPSLTARDDSDLERSDPRANPLTFYERLLLVKCALVEADLSARLDLAAGLLPDCDFIHVHTKVPDQAAHSKNCRAKRDVIEALDRAFTGMDRARLQRIRDAAEERLFWPGPAPYLTLDKPCLLF